MLYSLYLFHYILLYLLGRFDVNKCAVQCSSCHHAETLTWTLRDVVVAGYWSGCPTDTSYVFDQQLFFCGISCRRECLALQRALLWKLLKIFLLWEEGYDPSFVNNIKHLYVSYLYEVLATIYTVLKKLRVDDLLEKRKLLISFSLYIV